MCQRDIIFFFVRFKNISPRESHALPDFHGIVYICVLMYILFRRPATNMDLIAFFSLRGSETVTVKIRIKSTDRILLLFFTHSYVRTPDFSVWFLRYFWTKHQIEVVLAGFVTAGRIFIFILPHTLTK